MNNTDTSLLGNMLLPRGNGTKAYVTNNEFSDSKFMSQLKEEDEIEDTGIDDGLNSNSSNSDSVQRGNQMENENENSVMYATVQQRSKKHNSSNDDIPQFRAFLGNPNDQQNHNNTHVTMDLTSSNINNDIEIRKELPNELVVTQALDDISGYLNTNTFKRHDKQNIGKDKRVEEHSNISAHYNDTDPALEAVNIFQNVLKNQKSNYAFNERIVSNPTVSDSSYSDDLSASRLARSNGINADHVNISRQEVTSSNKPLGGKKQSRPESEYHPSDRNNSSSESLSNMSTSSQTPPTSAENYTNVTTSRKPKPQQISELPLITPESIGLIFNQENGVWQEPDSHNHDITNSHTVENTTSNSTTQNTEDSSIHIDTHLAENSNEDIRVHRRRINSRILQRDDQSLQIRGQVKPKFQNIHEEDEADYLSDDTPLDPPKINKKFLRKHSDYLQEGILTGDRKIYQDVDYRETRFTEKENIKFNENLERLTSSQEGGIAKRSSSPLHHPGDLSYRQNKTDLVSVLTDKLKDISDWEAVKEIVLSEENLPSVVGLNAFLPNLKHFEICNSRLSTLEGTPEGVVELFASKNCLSSTHILSTKFNHLEVIDISFNTISSLYHCFDGLLHLRKIIAHHNNISSIAGLYDIPRLQCLDLSHNSFEGVIDFAMLQDLTGEYPSWMNSLKFLDFSNNPISDMRRINHLTALESLDITNTNIKELECQNTYSSTNLTSIYFDAKLSIERCLFNNSFSSVIKLIVSGTPNFQLSDIPKHIQRLAIRGESKDQLDNSKLSEFMGYIDGQSYDIKTTDKIYHGNDSNPLLVHLEITGHLKLNKLPVTLQQKLPLLKTLNLDSNALDSAYNIIESIPTTYIQDLYLTNNSLCSPFSSLSSSKLEEALRIACPNIKEVLI